MRLTLSVIAICIVVFLLQLAGLIDNSFAFTPSRFYSAPYTIVTAMFMHSSLQHLMLNMIGLFAFGTMLEHELGAKRWLLIYFTSGFIASMGYALLINSPFIPAVGASGAIFGLIGAMAVLKPKQIIYTAYGPVPIILAAIAWGAIEFFSLFSIDNIAHSAHLFGLIGGVALAFPYKIGIDWRATLPALVLVPIAIWVITANMPKEVVPYQPQLPDCYTLKESIEHIDSKAYLYECEQNIVFTLSSATIRSFNLAHYAESLPRLSSLIYEDVRGVHCTTNTTSVEERDGVAYISGTICDQKFYAMATICDNVEMMAVQIVNNTKPPIAELNCPNSH